MVDSGDHSNLDVSELISELATLDLQSGRDKRSRQLFVRALVDPTENSLAQAEWALQKDPRVIAAEVCARR